MVKKLNKKTGEFDVVYPYTKVELLDMYKWLNAPPLVIYSNRRQPTQAWDANKKVELVKKYYIAYKEKLGLKHYNNYEKLAKFDTKEEAESVVNELRAQNPTFTDWEVKLHAFPK